MLSHKQFPWYSADGYDTLDPNGNITIKWDVMQWTRDGYVLSKQLLLFLALHFHNSSQS
jgi:hypothetical protein